LHIQGGISDSGSLRNISLSQIGEATQTVDFYDFLQNPSPETDPLIKNGARIFVPFKGPTVAVTGFVNNPGIYELPNDKSEISIKNLLSITGTSFLPSGAKLKISYFDANGQIATRLAVKNESLKEGEALQIGFIETRDLNISKVYGAVLKDFEIKTDKPLSIKEVIKDGAVLSLDTYRSFALIVGEEVQAINLDEALEDDSMYLTCWIRFTIIYKREYKELVASDPNISLNPLISKIIASNVAEIYLDGKRIAYVPTGQDQDFSELISNFYTPNPKTVYELALIENNNNMNAFDLKRAMRNLDNQKLSKGDRLFIYEEKFFNDILFAAASDEKSIIQSPPTTLNTETNVETLILQQAIEEENNEYLETIINSQRILQQADLINIKLDGKLFTYLPYINGVTSSFILKKLRNRFPILVNEFAVVQNINEGKTAEIKNLNNPFEIKQNEEINFISSNNYRFIIKNYDDLIETNLLSELKASNVVKVYYDGVLVLLLPPNYRPSELELFKNYSEKSDIYKLYVSVKTANLKSGTWDYLTFGSEEFFSASNNLILGASNLVNLYSNNFIKNNFINDTTKINGVDFNINTKITNQDIIENTPISILPDGTLEGDKIAKEIPINQNKSLNSQLKIMRNSLRTISGSVQFPGAYPVAKKIRLSNFLSTAGLIEDTARGNITISEAVNQKDRLTKGNPKTINLDDTNLNKVELSGLYYLDIPLAINDAITGIIELDGEILVPGKYSFTRSETLQDIIKRAGGLSDVAFPLGAILQRDSAKELEKQSNNILADQLEASILNLAQSSLEGAGDQVKVVLGYANQLRNQPTLGRMAVNIIDKNSSVPIFLEDGDKLTIPKRPSHVSIVGSVQRSTIAKYAQGQNFNDYLKVAGGLTSIADSRKAYLLLPNGESRQLNKSTIIPVGSVIIVPPKLDRLSILGGTDIISKVLSNISNSILSIQNVD
jgi:protein involved in polysaccharide export with SLBB domain